ncbi:hypothetical protein [Mycobacterium kyorinense]|uniref:Mycothiol-dependent maleylpyruvate isomerase metal-binding domain-containing protein n=1 Tax=Mycobacterium kyorinense TaxID=487514 RepID=A0A1X1XMG0_9MYCO|nr:hypothetical protein [Mycobacterium kyorinense]ORW00036.1 hypothetical protein AWC14_11220 [Mycobacterium kyorinense]
MKPAPVLAGPVDEVRRADADTRAALAAAVARGVELWRGIDNPGARVPGLRWTAAETAAHVVGDMREYAEALTRQLRGDVDGDAIPAGSPAKLRTRSTTATSSMSPNVTHVGWPTCCTKRPSTTWEPRLPWTTPRSSPPTASSWNRRS